MTTITVYATKHFDYADSYGLIACQLARHLTALGAHVNAVALGKTVMENQPEDVRAVTSRPLHPSLGGIVTGYPTTYGYHSSLLHLGPRVAVTMFESTKLPEGWVEPLNSMDAVVVPSQFCADVFRQCGVTAPVHVVPLGVSDVYQPVARPAGQPLTFLAFLDRGARKGGIVALQAFLRAFGDDTNYRLILKSRDSKTPFTFSNPNVDVMQRDMSEAELYELYARCDVLINPHKGEGFGLLPREFAATGGIALTTAWSGTLDGLGLWGWPLPYTLERADWQGNTRLEGQDLGEWATCDPEAVAERLRQVAANLDVFRTMARNQAAHVQRMYSWRTFAKQVLQIWEGVASGSINRSAAA
jgi:glycosyltransferase involved in cell wall biosynthesis